TFDETFFARENFNYDTEPAAKAVITMEQLAGAHAYHYYHEIQAAFYSRNQDITQPAVLADIAARYGVEPAAFLEFYGSEAAQRETWSQFEFSAALGIRGFPALVLEPLNEAAQNGSQPNHQFYLVTRGWQPYEQIVAAIAHSMKTVTNTQVTGESCEIDGACGP
ncbi:MAG: DsbA family protein, partial [Spirochaetes bacterium]|nr:DsbA family protein [Spirochaetota bacterium]